MEYLTALLLNLSLRTIGKDKFESVKHTALVILKDLMDHPNEDLRTYVNGTLYSILTWNAIKNLA